MTERDDEAPFRWGLTPSSASPSPSVPHPPVDDAIDGVTEAIHAHPIGLADPVDEGLEPSAVHTPRVPRRRAPMPTTQKVLLGVAGALLAALALVGLFVLGMRLSSVLGPSAAVPTEDEPDPAATTETLAFGPVTPGQYRWNELLGGECLQPFESAWQDEYTVLACAEPHAAQLVYRGILADEPDTLYPGVDALQQRVGPECIASTVIDYAAATGVNDLQVSTSFAADEAEWASGIRTFFCFVSRSSGEPLLSSVAVPQTGPPVPLPAETVAP